VPWSTIPIPPAVKVNPTYLERIGKHCSPTIYRFTFLCKNAGLHTRARPEFPNAHVRCHNRCRLGIASRPGIKNKTKHIALRYHFVRHHIADGEIAPVKCDTLLNVADVLTKAVDRKTFQRLAPMLVAVTKSSGADPV